MHIRRSRTIAILAVSGLVALAGCGSSDSTTSKNEGGATSSGVAKGPASTVSGTPIVVGSICSCTGPIAKSIGRSLDVVQAWAKWTNAHGGINGHPVKVVTVDDGQNPAKGLAGVKKLVEEDKVMAIVGQMSLTTASWEKYAAQKGVPVVGGQSVETAFLTNPDFFASGSTLPLQLFGELALAKQAGKKNVGLFYCAETPVCAQLEPILAGLGKQLGLALTATKIASTAPNYTAPCLSFKQKGVDALFVAINSSAAPRVVDACAQQGFKPLNLGASSTTERSWTKNPNLDGALVAGTNAVYTDEAIPGVKAFNTAIDQYLPDLQSSDQFSYPLIYPWAGGELFAAAAKAAKLKPSSTPADVAKGLYALKDETLGGVAPPLNFVRGKPGFPTCFFPAKLADGAFRSVGGGKPTCLDQATAGKLAAAFTR